MATIFNFRAAAPSSGPVPQRDESAPCEIIIFPGVRYERWEETVPLEQQASPGRKSRAKKRELELAD